MNSSTQFLPGRAGHGFSGTEFLGHLELSMLSQRRGPYAPFGLAGGRPGALGRNTLVRADGSTELLTALVQCQVEPGDVLIIETPGGGGFGDASIAEAESSEPSHRP